MTALWIYLRSGSEEMWIRTPGFSIRPWMEHADTSWDIVELFKEGEVLAHPKAGKAPCKVQGNPNVHTKMALSGLCLMAVGLGFMFRFFSPAWATLNPLRSQSIVQKKISESLTIAEDGRQIDVSIDDQSPLGREDDLSTVPQNKSNPSGRSTHPGKKWDLLKGRAQGAFLRGDLQNAGKTIAEAKTKNRGDLPEPLHKLAAEVEYAKCFRLYREAQWKGAVRTCEKAVFLHPHDRAKKILKEASERAKKLYLEAYAMERLHPRAAFARYEEIARFAPAADRYRWKAVGKLQNSKGVRSH